MKYMYMYLHVRALYVVLLQSSHLALLDALMKAYVSSVVTIPRVVRAIR